MSTAAPVAVDSRYSPSASPDSAVSLGFLRLRASSGCGGAGGVNDHRELIIMTSWSRGKAPSRDRGNRRADQRALAGLLPRVQQRDPPDLDDQPGDNRRTPQRAPSLSASLNRTTPAGSPASAHALATACPCARPSSSASGTMSTRRTPAALSLLGVLDPPPAGLACRKSFGSERTTSNTSATSRHAGWRPCPFGGTGQAQPGATLQEPAAIVAAGRPTARPGGRHGPGSAPASARRTA